MFSFVIVLCHADEVNTSTGLISSGLEFQRKPAVGFFSGSSYCFGSFN